MKHVTLSRATKIGIAALVVLTMALGGWRSALAQWQAGVARIEITPERPLWMAGFAARKQPSDGVCTPLYAKALVIQDAQHQHVVIVTMDLIGDSFQRAQFDEVGRRTADRTGIPRAELVFSASHTHCGPVTATDPGALITYGLDEPQGNAIRRYEKTLNDRLVCVIARAAGKLQPVTLAFGAGSASFAENRRKKINPDGPVDHRVPVLRVTDQHGTVLAVLFSYACHNTTLGADFMQYCGDYAGFAQLEIERQFPAAVAMFMMGCGGDANPSPRGTLELARRHGSQLARAVASVVSGTPRPVQGPLRVAMTRVELPFVDPPSRATLEQRRGRGRIYDQRLTEALLKQLDTNGQLTTSYPCPIQAIRFGDDLSLITLGGEVVVDYALRLRRELADRNPWIVGYCNEVFAYIPSERVLAEGGYEGRDAMTYFGHYGPFKPGVEELIVAAVKRVVDSQ